MAIIGRASAPHILYPRILDPLISWVSLVLDTSQHDSGFHWKELYALSQMVSERTPLLREENVDQKYDDVYDRFTPAQKRTIVALISMAGIAPCTLFLLLIA